MLRCLPLWCLLGLSAVLAAPSLEDEHSLPTDFVTPHTRWAKPSPDGSVRVLYFSDYRRCQAREIIELMQRFDLRAEAAYYTTLVDTTITQWHGGEAGVERIRRLLDQPFDVYLFQELALTRLPAELQYKLLKRVAEGAGLVLVGVDDARVLKRAIHGRPGWPEAELFAMRAGRAAKLPRTPAIPYRFGWETDYDHWQERLGRTVLWAANKLPDEQPLATLTSSTIDRAAPPAMLATVAGDGPLTRLRLRRSDGWVATDGPSPTSVPFPAGLPAGAYHLDVWRGSAWFTTPFTVTSPRTAEVQLAREWGEVTDPLAGSVVLQGQSLPGETVVVELLDRRGRILARSAGSARDGRLAFAFPLEPHYPMLIQVRATVADARGPAMVADAYYRLVKRHRDRFNFLVWDIPAGSTAPYAEEALAKLGMSLQLSGATPPPAILAAYDVAYVPYTTRIMDDKDASGQIKPVPWNQEPEIDAYVQGIADKYLPARQHGVFVYSLGDETVTRGSDNSPSDLAAYRRFLAEVYGQIGALNASWGTTYASFDEIALLDRNDPREQAAKQAGNYARWYDRQAWECRNFVNLCRRFGETYRKMDPAARTGFEGAGRFDKGDDFDGIVRTNGFWAPYPSPGDLLIRDIAPRDFPRANWTGYDKEPTPLIHEYWRMILNGNDSVWWWRWDNIGRFMGLLMPNLSPFAEILELWDDTRITREGLGDLLLSWEMQHDGIAMLYSMPSAYASLCGDGPSYGSYQQAHEAWHKSLFNAGLNFRYVTDEMLRRGEFDARQFKVLILPRAEALSDQEASAIRAFVAQGGTVVADLRPGRFDGRCKPRQAGALDDLLGVDTAASAAALTKAEVELSLDSQVVGRPRTTWKRTGQVTDPGVRATSAMALGAGPSAPAVLVRGVGQGRAVLLNLGLPNLAVPSEVASPSLLNGLLAQAGVTAPLGLQRAADARGDIRMVRWRSGKAEVVALQTQPNAAETEELAVALPEARRVLDLRVGRDLGSCREVRLKLRQGSAAVLAVLPGEPPRLQARLAAPTVSRPAAAALEIRVAGLTAPDAVLLTATRPDGSEADWVRQVVKVPADGPATVQVPLAINDPPGQWRLTIKELLTQKETTVPLTVR